MIKHKSNIVSILLLLAFISVLIFNCNSSYNKEDLKINAVWHKSYKKENAKRVSTGIKWYLNYLGATLPKDCFNDSTIIANQTFELNFNNYGFNEVAKNALAEIFNEIKESDYYKQSDRIDIGRLIVLTLNSTWHYYKITGAKTNSKEIFDQYDFEDKQFALAKGNSCIAFGDRKILIANDSTFEKTAFVGLEGLGSIADDSFEENEIELMEIMPNSFFKFAVYNSSNGSLIKGSNNKLSQAGKPAKCLWCHAQNINPAVLANISLDGFYSVDEFKTIVNNKMDDVRKYRLEIDEHTELDLKNGEEHRFVEMLYISFMQPSAMRLKSEWNLSMKETKEKLKHFNALKHHEFTQMGFLYKRSIVDSISLIPILKVPSDARETSIFEPNYFN